MMCTVQLFQKGSQDSNSSQHSEGSSANGKVVPVENANGRNCNNPMDRNGPNHQNGQKGSDRNGRNGGDGLRQSDAEGGGRSGNKVRGSSVLHLYCHLLTMTWWWWWWWWWWWSGGEDWGSSTPCEQRRPWGNQHRWLLSSGDWWWWWLAFVVIIIIFRSHINLADRVENFPPAPRCSLFQVCFPMLTIVDNSWQ